MTRSKSKHPAQSTDNGPRDRIIDSYLESIENSIRDNRPQIKLINYGTGSGKTHQLFQAICETIRKYPDKQIIGIYVAPLREHLRVPEIIEAQYQDIPIYPINSLEMKTSDDYIKSYKKWIPAIYILSPCWKMCKPSTNGHWKENYRLPN